MPERYRSANALQRRPILAFDDPGAADRLYRSDTHCIESLQSGEPVTSSSETRRASDRLAAPPGANELDPAAVAARRAVDKEGGERRGDVKGAGTFRVIGTLALALGLAPLGPSDLAAQGVGARGEAAGAAGPDTADALGATLQGWERSARLVILDRTGAFYGRLSDRGILQRFNPQIDAEYDLDLISSGFSLSDDYAWYRRDRGARFWAGSVNRRQLVEEAEAVGRVAIDSSWSVGVRFTHGRGFRAQRSLVWLTVNRRVRGGRGEAFLTGTLESDKPDSDLELGLRWSALGGTVTAAVGKLDAFNDFIYETLTVFPGFADSTIDYTVQPYTGRIAAELRPARGLRIEAYGLAMTPTRLVVQRQEVPGEGFRQEERYAYAGGLVEWSPTPRAAAGVFGTWVRARTGRTALPEGAPRDDFDLRERTWQAAAYAMGRPAPRVLAEGWAGRVVRTEVRERPPGLVPVPPVTGAITADSVIPPAVNYEDRAWAGRLDLGYRPPSGFRATLGFDFVIRDVTRGPDRMSGRAKLGRHNTRLRLDFGWRFRGRALFRLGTNFDLDGDPGFNRGRFDGAHGAFMLFW